MSKRYLPIRYVYPFDIKRSRWLGVDMLQGSPVANDVLRALQSAKTSVSSKTWVLKSTSPKEGKGIWFFRAVYQRVLGEDLPDQKVKLEAMVVGLIGFFTPLSSFHIDADKASAIVYRWTLETRTDAKLSNASQSVRIHLDREHDLQMHHLDEVSWLDSTAFWIALSVWVMGMLLTTVIVGLIRQAMFAHMRNQSILNSTFEGILTFDDQGDILDVNPEGLKILQRVSGYDTGNISRCFNLPKYSISYFMQRLELTGKGRKNHDKIWVECTIYPLKGAIKRQFTMFFRDITEKKKNHEERRKLATIVEQSLNAVILTDTDGKIEYVNGAFEVMSGYSLKELLGKNPRVLKSDKHDATYYKKMWSQLGDGKSWFGLFINRAKDGHMYEVEQHVFPLYDVSGDVLVGYTSIQQDVTERNRMQREQEHSQRLESLGVLAGGIAHDFNNLLTAILGNAELVKHSLGDIERCKKSLANIFTASHSAANLCRQMLAYAGKGQFVIRPIQLSAIIDEMSQLLRASIDKSVQLNVEQKPDLPLIDGDLGQIQQVLMNFIINASEALEGKEGVIDVHMGVKEMSLEVLENLFHDINIQEGAYVYMTIRDTGCGMDDVLLKKIFDPFFTTKFTGRGLGMSAVLGIVCGHHGALDVQSEVGKGTEFTVYFPVSHHTLKNEAHLKTDMKASTGTVLVIDDEEAIRELSACILEDMKLNVLLAKDGVEGLDVLQNHLNDVSLVLLDMTMPRMNGKQFYHHMQVFASHIPVVILSGYTETYMQTYFMEDSIEPSAHSLSFVEKPFSPEMLRLMVEKQLSGKRAPVR